MATKKKKEVKSLLCNKTTNKMQMDLVTLLRQKKGLKDNLEKILTEYLQLLPSSNEEVSAWYQSLPLDSLTDLCDYEEGKKIVFNLDKLHRRADLRKEKDEALEKIEEIRSNITISSIDILLEKIKIFEKKLA